MKFGKLLKTWAAEEKPENSELVLRFKDLKKQLKLVKPAEQGAALKLPLAPSTATGRSICVGITCGK